MTRTVNLKDKNSKNEIATVKKENFVVEAEEPKKIEEIPATPVAEKPTEETKQQIAWKAPSFYHNPQKKYIALIVTVLMAGAGIMFFYSMDILTAISLILSSLVLVLYSAKKPTTSKIVINKNGITVDDRTYHYRELKSFWLDYDPKGLKELSLEAKQWYVPYVKISIENQNPVEIRSLMINFIAEKEHEKSLTDLIVKKIGL